MIPAAFREDIKGSDFSTIELCLQTAPQRLIIYYLSDVHVKTYAITVSTLQFFIW